LVRRAKSSRPANGAPSASARSTFARCASPIPRTKWKPSRSAPRSSTKLHHSLALTVPFDRDAVTARVVHQHFG